MIGLVYGLMDVVAGDFVSEVLTPKAMIYTSLFLRLMLCFDMTGLLILPDSYSYVCNNSYI